MGRDGLEENCRPACARHWHSNPWPASGFLYQILGLTFQKNLGGPFEAQHGFVGFMDEVRLWSKALAIGTIRAQMDTSLGRFSV
jgi:hypothetical protein